MGMAASQVRLLQLTSRKNTIGYDLQCLSLEKVSNAREMKNVTKEYQNALNSKILKWSNNSGVSYVDLSYNNLMRPNAANGNKPYLITNSDDKVVIDDKYEKYAQMISPDGAAGGDWKGNRTKILSELTGLSEEKIETYATTKDSVQSVVDKINSLKEEGDHLKEPTIEGNTSKQFFQKVGFITVDKKGFDIGDMYNPGSNEYIELGNSETAQKTLKSILDGVVLKLDNYLSTEDLANFKKACNDYLEVNKKYFKPGGDKATNNDVIGIKEHKGKYSVNITTILDEVLGHYKSLSENGKSYGTNMMNTEVFYTRNKNSTEWQNWKAEKDEWQDKMDSAKLEYNEAVEKDNTVLTAQEESSIAFYDQLFSVVASFGWVADEKAQDNNYMNDMLQNNQYFITTVSMEKNKDGIEVPEYNTEAATNLQNVYAVNDSDIQNEALADYEYKKAIISEKESRIDTRMKNLETEQASINHMIKSIENVKNDNNERTMNIFT